MEKQKEVSWNAAKPNTCKEPFKQLSPSKMATKPTSNKQNNIKKLIENSRECHNR